MEKFYKDYEIIIKSHTDYPDYEDACSARDRFEASEIFARKLNAFNEDYWTPEMLEDSVHEVVDK
jgi:hypothetical protein